VRRHPDAPGRANQNVLEGVERKRRDQQDTSGRLNVKIRPYMMQHLVRSHRHLEGNLLRAWFLFIVLIFFLVSFRAAIITALTIPLPCFRVHLPQPDWRRPQSPSPSGH